MKLRLILMFGVLFLRLIIGWAELLKYGDGQQISVTGNIDKTVYNGANCIIEIGHFWVETEGFCAYFPRDQIRVIGTVKGNVINRLMGVLVLDKGKIDGLDNQTKHRESKSDFWIAVRNRLADIYRRSLPEPESGLLAGIVLGDKNSIGRDFYQKMINSGTVHIAVASGYNVMVIGGVCLSLLFWVFKRPRATLFCYILMLIYVLLTGSQVPVTRAAIMAMMLFGGQMIGRSSVSFWALLVTVWIMLVFAPTLIMDVSFQLSVMASVGLMIVEPMMGRFLERVRGMGWLSKSGVTVSLATMMTTAPVLWWHFGRLQIVSIISNLLILPLVPPIMFLGALMIPLGGLLLMPTYSLLHWVVMVVGWFGG